MVLSTSADSNWLADPNSGQILAYLIRVRIYAGISVMIVEKYVLQRSFLHPQIFSLVSLPLDQFPIY